MFKENQENENKYEQLEIDQKKKKIDESKIIF